MLESCQNCGDLTGLICPQCAKKIIQTAFEKYPTSRNQGINVLDCFHPVIYNEFNPDLKYDINELLACLHNELWTAAGVFCLRILESQLKLFIESIQSIGKIKDKIVVRTIGECIHFFKSKNYPDGFISNLDHMRDLRNRAMHESKRFHIQESSDTVWRTLIILNWLVVLRHGLANQMHSMNKPLKKRVK